MSESNQSKHDKEDLPAWPLMGKLKKKLKKKLSTSTQETPNLPEELFQPYEPLNSSLPGDPTTDPPDDEDDETI